MKILINNHRSNIDGFNPPDPKRERQVRLKPWAKLEQKQTQPTTNVLSFYILYQWITYQKKIHIYFISMNKCVCVIFPSPPLLPIFWRRGLKKQNQTFKNLQITYYIFGTFYRQIRHTYIKRKPSKEIRCTLPIHKV